MSQEAFLKKSKKNLEAAETLHRIEHYDGACNRAYYAMHDAVRSALIALGQERASASKTHSGLLTAFSLHVIRPGLIEKTWSTAIAQAERRRLLADYDAEAITAEDSMLALSDAAAFVTVISGLLDSLP